MALLSTAQAGDGRAWFNLSAPSDQLSWKLKQDTEFVGPWQGQSPKPVTMSAFRRSANASAFTCANVKAEAERRGVVLTQEQGSAQLRAMGLNGKYQFFHIFSLPAVAGDEAISIAVTGSNQLAGELKLILLKRTHSGWQVAGSYLIGAG